MTLIGIDWVLIAALASMVALFAAAMYCFLRASGDKEDKNAKDNQ